MNLAKGEGSLILFTYVNFSFMKLVLFSGLLCIACHGTETAMEMGGNVSLINYFVWNRLHCYLWNMWRTSKNGTNLEHDSISGTS